MKRLVFALTAAVAFSGSAMAADMAPATAYTKAPAPVAMPSWTGFYIGANAGYGFGRSPYALDPNAAELQFVSGVNPTPSSLQPNGFIGGAQIGYNQQFGNIVAGLETDLSYAGLRNSDSATGPVFIGGIFNTAVETRLNWFGTVRSRLGVLATPDLLFFAAGGLAYGEVRTTTTLSNLDGFNCTGLGAAVYCGSGATSGVSIGWTAGGGLEYAFARQWTVKAEYLYLDLGSQSVTFVDRDVAGSSLTATSKFTAQMVRAGLNYRF